MYGTVEQDNILRIIASQGKDFDLLAKAKKPNVYEQLGIGEDISINSIGQYSEAVEYAGSSERDRYLHCLSGTHSSEHEVKSLEETKNEALSILGSSDTMKARTLDMINGRRKRFVDRALIPPKHKNTYIEEAHKRDAERNMKQQEALNEVNKNIYLKNQKQATVDAKSASLVSGGVSTAVIDEEVQNLLKNRMKFLEPVVVEYGKGRLKSSHNLKGHIVEPWSTIGHNYATIAGDRTG